MTRNENRLTQLSHFGGGWVGRESGEARRENYLCLVLLQIQAQQSVIEQISGTLEYGMRYLQFYADWFKFSALLYFVPFRTMGRHQAGSSGPAATKTQPKRSGLQFLLFNICLGKNAEIKQKLRNFLCYIYSEENYISIFLTGK